MKVAFVHDYLKEIGGAERVLMALKEIWPEAPVYTAYAFPGYWGNFKSVLAKWDIRQSWGKKLPFLPKFLSYFTILSPLFFSTMDLSEYDVVIVSQTGGYFPNGVKIGKKTKLITYCHTPPRFLYGYPTATMTRDKWYWKVQSMIANHVLRMVDFSFAQRPHLFIANSVNVKKRIQKFYRRDAKVVYPPIDQTRITRGLGTTKSDFYLMVTRIVGSKNVELAIETAKKYKFNLKIAGRPVGKYGINLLKIMKKAGVEYLGEVDDYTKAQLYIQAKAVFVLEENADFGMVAVEPLMYNTPVIAFKGGGYVESIEVGKTGVFFEKITSESLWEAIIRFERVKWDDKHFVLAVKRFSVNEFKKNIVEIVNQT